MYNLILLVTLLLFAPLASHSAPYDVPSPIPDTGQTKCYDAGGNEIDCGGTGQDGEYTTNPMKYTTLNDGIMVRDDVTDLIWEVKADDDGVQDKDNKYYWDDAYAYCEDLALGGYNDWRLPSREELRSIVDYSVPYPGPMTNTSFFPNTSYQYWSSTAFMNYWSYMWYVSFGYAWSYDYDPKFPRSRWVRCVRGEQGLVEGRFVDNGTTVTDTRTNLVWEQKTDDSGNRDLRNTYTWQQALDYCNNLDLANKNWRLPNIKEIASLADLSRVNPAIDPMFEQYTVSSKYWSSTTSANYTKAAWYVDFHQGLAREAWGHSGDWDKSDFNHVRCVRCEQSGPVLPVYRFYNTKTGAHFFTIDEYEKNVILSNYLWFVYEGIAWRAYPEDVHPDTSRPIYRFYNTCTGSHFFTIDENEKNTILANYDCFNNEGIAFYAYTVNMEIPADTTAVYRFYNNDTGAHFFTTDNAEKDTIELNYPWFRYEGVAWYAFSPSVAAQ